MVDQSSNDLGLPVELTAIARDTWTDEKIAGLRAAAAAEPMAEFAASLVAALDEMILLRRELTECRLGQPPQARGPATRKEALERLATAWRAYLAVHLHLAQVTKDAPACAALPGLWWATIGNALLKACWDEENVVVLATVLDGLLVTGVLPPSDVREMLDNVRANAARKGPSGG